MPVSRAEKEFVAYVVELMQSIGPVSAKGMFGGHGIFLNGLMFGLISDGALYLKVDTETEGDFTAQGLQAFTYNKSGKEFKMSYYQSPEEILENMEEMNFWANTAYAAALRTASKKRKKSNGGFKHARNK